MAVASVPTRGGIMSVGREISTEFGVTLFQLSAGVFGGVAALVAANRLEEAPETLPLGTFVLPIAVAGVSTVVGAFLLPTGG